MKKQITSNQFTGGLIMDLNPLITPNDVLTNCLNGTLLTFNGNEYMLQNDMGNGRIETANLPEGYIPIGTCSHGGIIYIVSYNPLKNRAQIGSFPSPERNIDTTELDNKAIQRLTEEEFYLNSQEIEGLKPLNPSIRKVFDQILNPGDKYIVVASDLQDKNLSDYGGGKLDSIPRLWKIRLASLEESGKITELENLKWYNQEEGSYYIKKVPKLDEQDSPLDVTENRTLVNSAYSVFSPKKSGNLTLLISPEMVDAFGCSFSVFPAGKTKIRLQPTEAILNSQYFTPSNFEIVDTITKQRSAEWKKPSLNNSFSQADKDSLVNNTAELYQKCIKYDVFINSTWLNGGRDINPEGILVIGEWNNPNIICDKAKKREEKYFLSQKIGYNLSREDIPASDSSNSYIPAKERFEGVVLQEGSNKIYLKQINDIYRVYQDGKPIHDYFGRALYKMDPSTNLENSYVIKDDYINNNFNKDVSYKIGTFTIPAYIRDDDPNYKVTLDIYPYMIPGYLSHLKKSLTIDFAKVGKQNIKLNTWKYYVQEEEMFVDWALDAYTLPTQHISKVWLEFYDNQGLCATQVLDGLTSYNGNFQTKINLGRDSIYYGIGQTDSEGKIIFHRGLEFDTTGVSKEELTQKIKNYNILPYTYKTEGEVKIPDLLVSPENYKPEGDYLYYVNDSGIIYKGLPYYVSIKYALTNLATFSTEETFYELDNRWLWTCPIFNSKYEIVDDFEELSPELQLDLTTQYKTTPTYLEQVGNYSNAKDIILAEEEVQDRDQLSATLQYVSRKGNGLGNIQSSTVLQLEDNYGTFLIDKKESSKFILDTFVNKYDKIENPEQPEIIAEESDSSAYLLKTDSKIGEVELTTKQKELFGLSGKVDKKELWEELQEEGSFDNQYSLQLSNRIVLSTTGQVIQNPLSKLMLKTFEYPSVTGEVVSEVEPLGTSYSFPEDGIIQNYFDFEALYYSKYYTTAEKVRNELLYTFRPAVASERDLANYNLAQYSNNENSNNVIIFPFFKTGIDFFMNYERSPGHYSVTIIDYSVSKAEDSNIEFNMYCSKRDTEGGKIESKEYHKHLDYVINNSPSKITNMIDSVNFMFPIHTHSWQYPILPQSGGKVNNKGCGKINIKKSYFSAEDIAGGIRNISKPLYTCDPDNSIILKETTTGNYTQLGGFVGITAGDKLLFDFDHPVTSYEDTDNLMYLPYFGTALTFYAKIALGFLSQIYFRTNDNTLKNLRVFDNYTYYNSKSTQVIWDVVFKTSYKGADANSTLLISGLKYTDYIKQIINNVGKDLESELKRSNLNFSYKEMTKNCPLQFNFEYKQPDITKIDLTNKSIVTSLEDELQGKTLIIDCEEDTLYVYNKQEKQFEVFTSTSKFTPALGIKNGKLILTLSHPANIKDLDTTGKIATYTKDQPLNYSPLPQFTFPALANDCLQIVNNVLKPNQVLQFEKYYSQSINTVQAGNKGDDGMYYNFVHGADLFKFIGMGNLDTWKVGESVKINNG